MSKTAKIAEAEAGDALLGAALASMPYGFTIWDEERRLVLWNETYLRMYHLPADRIRSGMSLQEVAEVSATSICRSIGIGRQRRTSAFATRISASSRARHSSIVYCLPGTMSGPVCP